MSELETKLGELLRLERERRDLSLEEISAQLKISEDNLQSVEMGAVDNLPDKLYFTLFAKAYCEAVGIDYERTIEAIREDLGEFPEPPVNDTKLSSRKPSVPSTKDQDPSMPTTKDHTSFLKPALWGLGGLVVAFIMFMLINTLVFNDTEAPTGDQDTESAALKIEADQSAHDVDRQETTDGATESFNWDIPTYQPPKDLKLTLNTRGQSWATVLADGDTALFDNLQAGREYEVTAHHRLRITIAVPAVVDININGQEVDIADPTSGRIRRVVVDQTNVASILTERDLSAPQEQDKAAREMGSDTTGQDADVEDENISREDESR